MRAGASSIAASRTTRELQSLNAQFRRKDYATDVLSFRRPNGDIAISLDRARAQAREWGHTVEDEIRILMLHGVLHLIGMDHESDNGQMERSRNALAQKTGTSPAALDRAGRRMIFAALILLLVLVTLFTAIQTLYLEGMRLRTRDLPSLQYFKSDLEPRLNLRAEEGTLTFSLWKHSCLRALRHLGARADHRRRHALVRRF